MLRCIEKDGIVLGALLAVNACVCVFLLFTYWEKRGKTGKRTREPTGAPRLRDRSSNRRRG